MSSLAILTNGFQDRLWCDPGPKDTSTDSLKQLPTLHAIILDFSSVNNVDITSVQGLIDLRNSLDRHAAPGIVDWHFAHVYNRWTRRALAVAGFGYPSSENAEALGCWKPAVTLAALPRVGEENGREDSPEMDQEGGGEREGMASLNAVDRPFFHVDLVGSVRAAVAEARKIDCADRE